MKQFLLIMSTCLLGFTTFADEQMDIKNASVGQTFALKNDVIFNEGVEEVYLYQQKINIFNIEDKATHTSTIYCKLTRDEKGDDGACPNYPKAIVKAEQVKVIRYESSPYYMIDLGAYTTKNKCRYTLSFTCDLPYNLNLLNSSQIKEVKDALYDQATLLISVQDDHTKPITLP